MPSSPIREARQLLGARLRDIRRDASLSGRALADTCGWHFTKVSKIEHGAQPPNEADIRAWCRACGAASEVPELIASLRAIDSMYVEWRRYTSGGIKHAQKKSLPLYERTTVFRIYEHTHIPGLLQTAGYAGAMLSFWQAFLDLPDDVEQGVAARLARQQVMYTGERRFIFVLEEQVLYTNVGGADVMSGQLDRLLVVMSLPRVSLGIIPRAAPRTCLAQGSFWLFDESRVEIENVSAGLDITQPREIALYLKVFAMLQNSAVYGGEARGLIEGAVGAL